MGAIRVAVHRLALLKVVTFRIEGALEFLSGTYVALKRVSGDAWMWNATSVAEGLAELETADGE